MKVRESSGTRRRDTRWQFRCKLATFARGGLAAENRGVPGSSPGLATLKPHSRGIYCFSDCADEAINGYSIGFLGAGVFRVRDRKASAEPRWGLVRDGVTTISVVADRRTSRHEINVGLATLEREALDGRLEIHVVLDDADTKLHRLKPARGGMAPGKGLHEARNRVQRSRHGDTGQTNAGVGRNAGARPAACPSSANFEASRSVPKWSIPSGLSRPAQSPMPVTQWRHPGGWRHSLTHPWDCGITDSARRAKRPIAASPVASSRR
jgi:hypothetical protein